MPTVHPCLCVFGVRRRVPILPRLDHLGDGVPDTAPHKGVWRGREVLGFDGNRFVNKLVHLTCRFFLFLFHQLPAQNLADRGLGQ